MDSGKYRIHSYRKHGAVACLSTNRTSLSHPLSSLREHHKRVDVNTVRTKGWEVLDQNSVAWKGRNSAMVMDAPSATATCTKPAQNEASQCYH